MKAVLLEEYNGQRDTRPDLKSNGVAKIWNLCVVTSYIDAMVGSKKVIKIPAYKAWEGLRLHL
jgi:hypothetical protein